MGTNRKTPAVKAGKRRSKKRRYERWKQAGLCRKCGGETTGKALCPKHHVRKIAAQRVRTLSKNGGILRGRGRPKLTEIELGERQVIREHEKSERMRRKAERMRDREVKRTTAQELRDGRKEAGLCPECGNPAVMGGVRCAGCRDKDKEARRIANAKIAEAGLCQRCRVSPVRIGVFCEECWYKSKAQGFGGSGNWKKLRDLLVSQDFQCAYSGKLLILGPDASIDHKIPRSRGGSNDVSNLQWVSRTVNQMKTVFTHQEFLRACEVIVKRWKQSQQPIELVKKSMLKSVA